MFRKWDIPSQSRISTQERRWVTPWSLLQIQLQDHHPPDAAKAGAGGWQRFLITSCALLASRHFWSFNCSRVRQDDKTWLHPKFTYPSVLVCYLTGSPIWIWPIGSSRLWWMKFWSKTTWFKKKKKKIQPQSACFVFNHYISLSLRSFASG